LNIGQLQILRSIPEICSICCQNRLELQKIQVFCLAITSFHTMLVLHSYFSI
jgi:hypothetical protein